MQLDSLWQERIERDVCLLEDTVLAATGSRLDTRIKQVIAHQLERLVGDVITLTRQESDQMKPPSH